MFNNLFLTKFLECFRCYQRDKLGRLKNASYVDLSYKWAGGGFLSTVGDLIKFGNVLMYCYQVKYLRNFAPIQI